MSFLGCLCCLFAPPLGVPRCCVLKTMEKPHHPSLSLIPLSPSPSLSQSAVFPAAPPGLGETSSSRKASLFSVTVAVTWQSSIKVVTSEMRMAMVIFPFSVSFFPFLSLFGHLSEREKPGLIISWHILYSLKNVSCRPVRKLFLGLVSPSFHPSPPPPL